MNVKDFAKKKAQNKKITAITCYDYITARIIEETNIDVILVGDSVAMVIHGYENTIPATIDMMATHIAAVARGIKTKFIIGDMPFMSYHKSIHDTMTNVEKLIRAGAHAVKLEGVTGFEDHIRHIVQSGVPVIGHLGLTPQSINSLGGFVSQGKTESDRDRIIREAETLQDLGCSAVVLECVPAGLAKEITEILTIPTIGIGAGPDCSGQILVLHDLLGMQIKFKPKFLKTYMDGHELIKQSLNTYVKEVEDMVFPNIKDNCY